MNRVAAFALRRKNSILSMSEEVFCPPQPLRFWITPACAGKRPCGSSSHRLCRDHPRMCGEKSVTLADDAFLLGSLPRVRGKGCGFAALGTAPGITPACTGKSCSSRRCCGCRWDHPRMCGEKFHPASDRKLGRVRGTKRSSGPAPAAVPAGLAGSCLLYTSPSPRDS